MADEDEAAFCVPLGAGTLRLSMKDARILRSLVTGPGYRVLRDVLSAMNSANKRSLQDVDADIDCLRVAQGKVLAVAELATILETDLQAWYDEGQSNKAKAEESA